MVNYTMANNPEQSTIAFLTADDLEEGMTSPIELDTHVDEIRLTKDAGELLAELTDAQRDKHTGQWGDN